MTSATRFGLLALAVCQLGALVWCMPTSRAPSQRAVARYNSDFVANEAELQAILTRLETEAADSIRHPRNFVGDDVPLDEIIRNLIDSEPRQGEEAATAATTTTTGEPPSSAPTASPGEEDTSSTTTTTTVASETTTSTTPLPIVESDEEFEAVLALLRQEARDSIGHPMNYVQDEAEVAQLAEQIARNSGNLDVLLERWNSNKPLVYEPKECPICREELEPDDECTLNECKHCFHRRCIGSWFRTKLPFYVFTCPVCRTRIAGLPRMN